MNIDHLVVIVKLGSVQADAVNFAFAYLVIIRIRPKSLFDRAERRLEFGVCHHPEGIQVAEIKSAAFFIPSAESAASEGEVGMKPAEGCYIELRPVMRADGIRCGREADCQRAGIPAIRHKVMKSRACTPQSPFRLTAQYSGIHCSIKYSFI